MNKIVLFFFCVLIMSVSALGQFPPPPLHSPEVQSDGHVIFRFRDPNAQKVEVQIEGQIQHVPMQKDEQGVWTVTTGPMQPDFYGYSFLADGVGLLDPSNPVIKPNLLNPGSEVHVPGPPSLTWELNQVPHGEIHQHFYHSKIADLDSDFYVYTPPGYWDSKQDYPVLYLLHGFSDDASGWTAVGRANVIFDNLIAEGKMTPMVVAMPLGYGDYDVIRHGWGSWQDKDLARHNLTNFTNVLLNEVIPQVEASYRVKKDRESRAIAGLSMGGAESLLTGLNHLDEFAWIGGFSSGGIDLQDFGTEFPGLDASVNKKLKLLWIACGTEDGLLKVNRQFKSWLKDKGVQFTDIETPGMHTWMVWRRNLSAFAPLLFK
ncbi:MAG TPA: alpha/beta hydrolase-fold protein [Terriglobales bacterium]|nr:alpha/beta hydrolase-fold protein [Terriglobales bacterium]